MPSHIRRTRYGYPARQARLIHDTVEIFDPTRGLHSGIPPQKLPPGFTPRSDNFVVGDDCLCPRSGLSQFKGGDSLVSFPVIGGLQAFDVEGNSHIIAASLKSFSVLASNLPSWKTLDVSGVGALSGTSRDYWQMTQGYHPRYRQNVVVATNGLDGPVQINLQANPEASTFTHAQDFLKNAKSVLVADERLVFLNVLDADSIERPGQLVWSVRGNIENFSLNAGAGARDLFDMRGKGEKLIPEGDGFLLVGDSEIWRGRPRRDNFAFDVIPVARNIASPFPNTVTVTPIGTVFLGRDFEVYAIAGNQVRPLGPVGGQGPSRVQKYLKDNMSTTAEAWATYNEFDKRWELYFNSFGASGDYADKGLFYHLENDSFLEQSFAKNLSWGFPIQEPGSLTDEVTWDEQTLTWDNAPDTWNRTGLILPDNRRRKVIAFDSAGVSYSFSSAQTTDDGSRITAKWRSHGIQQGSRQNYSQMNEVWTEYGAPSPSSASYFVSDDLGASFTPSIPMSIHSSFDSVAMTPTCITARSPQFEVRLNDGGRPRFNQFWVNLVDRGRFGGGR